MADLRKKLGNFGEQAAAAHLARLGYVQIARQWRGPGGELDLIMRDGAALVFVEVRTRRASIAGIAEESVGRAKRARLIALAYAYIEAAGLPETTSWRIDVIAVDIDRGGRIVRLAHIRDAIEEG